MLNLLFGKTTPLTEEQKQYQSTIKGDLDTVMDTVVCHGPISLWDHDEKKLNESLKGYNPEEMYKKFKEKYMNNFEFPKDTDDYRPLYANNDAGGIDFYCPKTIGIIRGMAFDVIKELGRKILNGDFNLTTVTIPIKVMVPLSILQHVCNGHFNFPLYLNLAAENESYVEKMKYIITATLSCWYRSSVMLKPLNPILGETYEMIWEDGSHEYVEQTSHHPPCSNFIMYGPNNNYKYCGYLNFTSNAWPNSMKLTNTGNRFVEFKDGTKIVFDYSLDNYSNTIFGTFRHESTGDVHFEDITHGIKGIIKLGGNKKFAYSDYFDGSITDKDGKVLSEITGSYLSHVDFDGKRYWDIRRNIDIEGYPYKNQLLSSSIYRADSNRLYEKKMEEAQKEKINLEELQRKDRRLRKEWIESHKNIHKDEDHHLKEEEFVNFENEPVKEFKEDNNINDEETKLKNIALKKLEEKIKERKEKLKSIEKDNNKKIPYWELPD